MKKTTTILLSLLGLLLIIVGCYFLFIAYSFRDVEDDTNTPMVKLSDLTWPNGLSTIYYENEHGLQSIRTDGTDKKTIYYNYQGNAQTPGYPEHPFWDLYQYYLLQNSKQILIMEKSDFITVNGQNNPHLYKNDLALLDSQGKTRTVLYTSLPNEAITLLHFSPDQTKGIFALSLKDRDDQILIVDVSNKQVLLQQPIEGDAQFAQSSWSPDGTKLYFTTDSKTESIPYVYSTYSNTIEKLDPTFQIPVEPNEASYPSPNRQKTVMIQNESIQVNKQEVMLWGLTSYGIEDVREYCNTPVWLPDNNHFTLECWHSIRIVETDTKKAAILVDKKEFASDVQYFK